DDGMVGEAEIGLRGIGLLIGQRKTDEEAVERLFAAIEFVDRVPPRQLLDAKGCHAGSLPEKMLRSFRSLRMRGMSRTGASSAFMKVCQRSASSPKCLRSASASSARSRALSRTKSLTER